jgi:hypothetical protein
MDLNAPPYRIDEADELGKEIRKEGEGRLKGVKEELEPNISRTSDRHVLVSSCVTLVYNGCITALRGAVGTGRRQRGGVIDSK